MTFSGRNILEYAIPEVVHSVTPTQAILYALSVGYGAEPLDRTHLRYLYEDGLVPAPTLANVVAHPGPWLDKVGVDWKRLVHAEHRLTLHRMLPLGIPIACRSKTLCVVDRGQGKGLFVTFERVLTVEQTGEPVATIVQTNACRGDGGGGSAGVAIEPLPPVPEHEPDAVLHLSIPASAAVLYRLNGDLNPLHIDPVAAAESGFARPILHGLCTFGHAGYALARLTGRGGLSDFGTIAARFSAPAFPGEPLEVQMWRDGDDIRFRCLATKRGVVVLGNGVATVREASVKP